MDYNSDNYRYLSRCRMPSLTPRFLSYEELTYSVGLSTPEEWRKAYRSLIRMKITYRDPMVGSSNFGVIIPREWCGRWYLYRDGYQTENGEIDFRTKEIYSDTQDWLTGPNLQQLGQRVPVPETDEETENIEELSEFFVLGGEVLAPLVQGLNIPIIGDIVAAALNFFENLSSDDIYYLPFPYRPDRLYVSIPDGMVSVNVSFIWWEYSKIAVAGGIGEIDIQDVIELPDTGQPPEDPVSGQIPFDFDDYAESRGYVKASRATDVTPDEGDAVEGVPMCDGADSGTLFWTVNGVEESLFIEDVPFTIGFRNVQGVELDWTRLDYIDDVSGPKSIWMYGWTFLSTDASGVTRGLWVTSRNSPPSSSLCGAGTPTDKIIFRIEPGTDIVETPLNICGPPGGVEFTVNGATNELFRQTYDEAPLPTRFECSFP